MITLLVLYVADLQRSREFYQLLGLRFVEEQHGDDGPVHYAAELPRECVLELYPAGDRPVTRVRLGLEVADVANTAKALVEAGFTVRENVAVDPDGNKVELRERSTYWAGMSASVEARAYTVAGPVEIDPVIAAEIADSERLYQAEQRGEELPVLRPTTVSMPNLPERTSAS